MPPERKVQDEFLQEVQQIDPLFELNPKIEDTSSEEEEEKPSNRRERRLREQLEAERKSSADLAQRLLTLTEAQKFSKETNADVDDVVARIYGTNTPEGQAATELLQRALNEREERAVKRALESFEKSRQEERDQESKESARLDSMIEEIEDESNTAISREDKKEFFSLLEKMSPKDRRGNVTEYADHHAVWELYQEKRKPQSSQARDLASRSMTRTSSSPTEAESKALEKYMLEQGYI